MILPFTEEGPLVGRGCEEEKVPEMRKTRGIKTLKIFIMMLLMEVVHYMNEYKLQKLTVNQFKAYFSHLTD